MPESDRPPAGGYGAAPPSKRFGPATDAEAEAADAGGPRRSLKPFITVGLIVATLSTLVVLAIVGVRRYIHVAKTAEARNTLRAIAESAAVAHAAEHRICPSASRPVPADLSAISGRKYQTSRHEWLVDKPKNAGFACLQFEYSVPQYYQYSYDANASSFTAHGRGDLNGDGKFSDFTWSGRIEGDKLMIAPDVSAGNTEE